LKLGKIFAFLLLILTAMIAFGQTGPNLEAGFKPYGSYHGSDTDSVSIMNGNVTWHIPFPVDYPQRGGKLNASNVLLLHSKTWKAVVTSSSPVGYAWVSNRDALGYTDSLHPSHARSVGTTVSNGQTIKTVFDDKLMTWDGASHPVMDISNGQQKSFEAIDGSGWRINTGAPDSSGLPQTAVIIDREGTQYNVTHYGQTCPASPSPGGFSAPGGHPAIQNSTTSGTVLPGCTQHGIVESVTDVNGNVYTMPSNNPWTDTMGKNNGANPPGFNPWGFGNQPITQSTSPAGCTGAASYYGSATIPYPGQGGKINQILVCYANYNVQTSFGVANTVEAPNTQAPETSVPLVSSIVLADGSSWTFSYDSYLNITSIGLPLGGTISYQWGTVAIPDPASGTGASRAVTQRTITDNNGHSYVWKYQWLVAQSNALSANGTFTNVVTDPAGNDTVHVFTDFQAAGAFYETTTQFYQGAYTAGQLL
jgi:YD repeat-containing protein